ncbi:hypothetical protein BCR44DRAFT_1430545 [Catenaria anguillulae PL171]|uniref:Uncharacterized protein n=1 Tax=Catenaria anguillulae PL171 TaxID=765915 RepID=A0A1Y2HV88_9FUNG|nr:hypothetical protein BCR44DRAFT_1430545 [Catenaria anguillulae PL171]
MVAWVVVRYGRYAGQRSVQHKFERINISSSNSNSSPSSHSSRRASNTVQPRMATAYSRHMSHLDRTRPQPESVLLLPTTCHVPVPTPATAPTTTTTTRLTPTPRLPPRPMMLPPGTPRPPPMMPTSILSPTASTASFHNLSTLLSIDPHRRHPGTPPITHLATSPTSTSHLATREHILAVDFPHALPATLSRGARIRAALVQSLTSLLTHTDPSVANATNVAQSMSALGCFVTLGKAHELVAAGRRVVAGVQAAAACMAEREPGAGAGAGEAWVEWLARPRVGQWFVEYVEGDTASARGMVDYCLKMDDNDCERGNGRQPKRVVHSVVAPGLAVPFPADGDRVWLVPARVWTRPAAAL